MRHGPSASVRLAFLVSLLIASGSSAWALEQNKKTNDAPTGAAHSTDDKVTNRQGEHVRHDEPSDMKAGYWYLLEDKGYFLPPLADVNIPTNYMRGYLAHPVAYSTNQSNATHVFWDV